jgi:hypothetical protein
LNCQRTQSLLSAFLDGELTGEEMLLVRRHVFSCNDCHKEFVSLQVVKRLLGSLDSVDANDEWQSRVTAHAYAGCRPWWEKRLPTYPINLVFETVSGEHSLTPRGRRTARVLALSAIVVLLAASPFARYDRPGHASTGNISAGMGFPMLFWPINVENVATFNTLSSPVESRGPQMDQSYQMAYPPDTRQVSDMLRGMSPMNDAGSLTLTVSGR